MNFILIAFVPAIAMTLNLTYRKICRDRLKKSLGEEDLNVIFNKVLLIEKLAEPKGQQVFELLRTRFKNDESLLVVVNQYETQLRKLQHRNEVR